MGGQTFTQEAPGETAGVAFDTAVKEALWEYGHGGYSGTIAEKHDFVLIDLPPDTDPYDFAEKLISDGDPRIDDKWGPAGAVKMPDKEGRWLFFGWASS